MIHLILLTISILSAFMNTRGESPFYWPPGGVPRRWRSDEGWTYGVGVEVWPVHYPACGGSSQSPIALQEDMVENRMPLSSLQWGNLKTKPYGMTLFNNGHTVELKGLWPDGQTPYIELQESGQRFDLKQVHWHWGNGADDGTEHEVEGRMAALEMHMVFTKVSGGGDANALVYGQRFQYESGEAFTPLGIYAVVNHLREVRNDGESVMIYPVFTADDLILPGPTRVFFYSGSLTTPPCTEPILWLMAVETGFVRDHEINAFRSLNDKHGDKMAGNVRPLQPRNGRKIELFE